VDGRILIKFGTLVQNDNVQGRRNGCEGGGTISRAERAKKFFYPPHLWLTWGDMKQDIAVFFTAIMTSDLD